MNKLGIDPRLYSATGAATVVDMARRYVSSAFRKRRRAPVPRGRARMSKRVRFSKTKYKRKARKGFKNVQGKNVSVKNLGRKLPRVYYPLVKGTSQQIYDFNGSFNVVSQQGRQAFDEISMGGAINGSALNLVNGQPLNSNAVDLTNIFYMTPLQQAGALAFTKGKQSKILLRSIKMTVFYTNMTDGYLHFSIYDVLPRRDTQSTPLTHALQGQRTLFDATATGGNEVLNNDATLQLVGSDLTQIPYFNQKYMIVNRRTIIMNPGQVHRHTINYRINRMFNASMLDGANNYLKGFSAFHIVRIHGFPADTADNTITTFTSSKVSAVWRKTIKYHLIQESAPRRIALNNLEDDGVALENMNEDGDVEVQANA